MVPISNEKKLIVVFEDVQNNLDKLISILNVIFSDTDVKIVAFPDSNGITENPFESMKSRDIIDNFLTHNSDGLVEMVIIDLDLTQYTHVDISEPLISDVCHKNGIPICIYSQYVVGEDIEHLINWSEGKIVINRNDTFDNVASHCAIIYRGFQIIKSELGKNELSNPIKLLTNIMDAPVAAGSQIALYSSGHQSMMGNFIKKHIPQFMTSMLGYWLHNSILRFPGVLLNEIATASYLNIDVASFKERSEINQLFDEARYVGPFHELGPYWWRDSLDELLAEVDTSNGEEPSGLSLLKNKGITDVSPAKCIEGEHDGAGFYCIISQQSVCSEHSEGNISWLPAGATLSRICNSKWDELGPWFGF